MLKNVAKLLLLLCAWMIPFKAIARSSDLDSYLSKFYQKEIKHFERFGEFYEMPLYGIRYVPISSSMRRTMEAATFYKYAIEKNTNDDIEKNVRKKIFQATIERKSLTHQSFEDAITNFLVLNYINTNPKLFTVEETRSIREWMGQYLFAGIKSPDTENRAVIASALWQVVADDLFKNGFLTRSSKTSIDTLVKRKIDKAIKQTVNGDFWYLEGGKFSPHYHLITAFMMALYGDTTKQKKYLIISREMTKNIRKITFQNGLIVSDFNHRPVGSGAQTYLMAAILSKRFKFSDYSIYLTYSGGNRFFSDKNHPNRLEFHSAIEKSKPMLHDDLAFVTAAELGNRFLSQNLTYDPIILSAVFKNTSADKTFTITNIGKIIVINNSQYNLGSYGNWYNIVSSAATPKK